MGKTRLHATCRFYSAVVIKASLLHLFFTNRGRRLGASSRFKTWSLVFWCLLTETLQVIWWSASANQYNYDRSSPETFTTHNLCCSKGFETITLKSIHGFKLGSAKSMFALFYFYFFTFPMIFPLQIKCVCVCVSAFSNCIYNFCAHASCNFLYGHAIQCDIKVQGLEKWGCIGWTNFSPWSRICDITEVWLLSLQSTAWPEIGIRFRKLLKYRSHLHIFNQRPWITHSRKYTDLWFLSRKNKTERHKYAHKYSQSRALASKLRIFRVTPTPQWQTSWSVLH